jgi:AbrB family looped-hinge helix DNA binding protein
MKTLGDSKVTGKFQVTVPKHARQKLNLGSGDRLVFLAEDEKVVVKKGSVKTEA